MPSPPNLRRNFSDLLPRKPFNKWFYAIFFKLALPFNCDIRYFQVIIYAPLNFTIIFRLLCQLRLLGYPSHWLSEALTNILDDKVITSARPPWKLPMKVPDVKHDYPEKKLTTAPFRQEFATLTQLFQPLLPFSLASRTIPPLSTIHSYTIAFPSYTSYSSQQTCLLLVFYNPLLFPSMSPRPSTLTLSPTQAPPPSLRPLLDPSPASEIDPSFCGPQYTRFREEGVACWTSFSWDAASRTARAWMSTTLVDKLVKEDWCCALWRVDLWCPVAGGGIGGGEGKGTKSCKVADIVVKGEAWHD